MPGPSALPARGQGRPTHPDASHQKTLRLATILELCFMLMSCYYSKNYSSIVISSLISTIQCCINPLCTSISAFIAFNLTKDIAQPMEGENVEMLSTSGLTTNNVEVKFTFSPIGKENIKVAECPPIMRKPHKVKPNWVITRLDNNCQLLVMDVTSADDGSYEAVGLLPSGDVGGKYVYAYSNSVQMRVGSETTLGPASIESKSSILGYAVALAVTLVCIVVAVVAIFFLVRRYPCIGPLPGMIHIDDLSICTARTVVSIYDVIFCFPVHSTTSSCSTSR